MDSVDKIIVMFYPSVNFAGNVHKNPFSMQHCNISSICSYWDNISEPTLPLKLNFDPLNPDWTIGYYNMYKNNGHDISKDNIGLGIDAFIGGYTMFVFNPSSGLAEGNLHRKNNRNIRVETYFRTPLTEAMTCLIYGVAADTFTIDGLRNVVPSITI